jgi:hypothetical protein
MAKRPGKPSELPEALRDAVERTVDATLGSAGRGREAAQGALDDLAGTVDELRRGAEDRLSRSRRSVAEAIEGRRLATHDDIGELKAELRAIGRRLDAIEERLPAKRARSAPKPGRASGAGRSSGAKSSRSGSPKPFP